MARRLSKRKISCWILLIGVIVFFCVKGKSGLEEKDVQPNPIQVVPDIPVDENLTHRLDSFVNRPSRDSITGVIVYDLTARKSVYEHNADVKLAPASNMKMLTCIAVLDKLGADYVYHNGVYIKGELRCDTLVGDLSFKFTFDPSFDADSLRILTDAVADSGIKRVKGRVIVDIAVTHSMQHEEHWTPGDLKRGVLNLLFLGEKRVLSDVGYLLSLSGVSFDPGQLQKSTMPSDSKLLREVNSSVHIPIFKALQNSSNVNAEALLYPLAGSGTDSDDFRQKGVDQLKIFITEKLKMNSSEYAVVHDGSGLCSMSKVTPRFLCRLFEYAFDNKPICDELLTGLPISGQTGTLHDRMMKIKGAIRAKTGTLTREGGITSLAGYAQGSNGHDLVFVIIQNGFPVADARLWQDRFCEELIK